eukprot:367682_1
MSTYEYLFTLPPCPLRNQCELVKTGQCDKRHKTCDHGHSCWKLAKRQCTYYHPPNHFNLSTTTDKHKETSNSTETVHDPKNHRKKWSIEEDKQLHEFMMTYPDTYNSKQMMDKLVSQLDRTDGAIKTRLTKVKTAMKRKDNGDKENSESDLDGDFELDDETLNINDSDDTDDIGDAAKSIYICLNQLMRYYALEENQYEIKNLHGAIAKLKACKFNGDRQVFHDIVGCSFAHFEETFGSFVHKHGAINTERIQHYTLILKLTKEKLKQSLIDIDRLRTKMEKSWIGQEDVFKEMSGGHGIQYFEGIVKAIDGHKEMVVNGNRISNVTVTRIKTEENEYKEDTTDNRKRVVKRERRRGRSRCRDRSESRSRSRSRSRSKKHSSYRRSHRRHKHRSRSRSRS